MDKSATEKTALSPLYPMVEPFDRRLLAVSGGHEIYVEQSGNPDGQPVVVLHGGPGGGCSPAMRRFFDPFLYRVVLFDQRGCGRSRPNACVEENTTWHLVSDIERIRRDLCIDRWIVFGGSWGATLALVYAETHSHAVAAMVLRGVFLATKSELEWFYGGGAAQFWPREWDAFVAMIPKDERGDLIGAYHRRLFGGDRATENRFARAWTVWESSLATLEPSARMMAGPAEYARAFARLENHYFKNAAFLDDESAILQRADRIAEIPGVIVQGRYDMVCPPARAFQLAQTWPGAELRIVPAAGHALSEPGIAAELVRAMDRLAGG
ncbi:MAG: prolyl aminopeptidase [Paracoccaceae bacterium]